MFCPNREMLRKWCFGSFYTKRVWCVFLEYDLLLIPAQIDAKPLHLYRISHSGPKLSLEFTTRKFTQARNSKIVPVTLNFPYIVYPIIYIFLHNNKMQHGLLETTW